MVSLVKQFKIFTLFKYHNNYIVVLRYFWGNALILSNSVSLVRITTVAPDVFDCLCVIINSAI